MSEPDKPAVTEVTTAASGTGPLEGTGGEDVAEKSVEKENGMKPIEEHDARRCEKKGEDVKMEGAADKESTVEEESKVGKDVEEEEPLKEEMEEENNEEHKDGEAIEVNDEEAMEKGKEIEEKGDEGDQKTEEIEEKGMRKKRAKRAKSHESGEKDKKIGKKGGRKAKEVLSTPIASFADRPVRERKTVERLVETLLKEPSKALLIEKGRGTPLKDIPNVAYKLSKKKPGDIRSLHLLLFGRKGKATNYKSHIFQFSGFVWHDNEEKQRAKLKEKLDKCVKDKLLDFCDVFDVPVSRATSRKEDLVEKLLDFMVAPHATTDVLLAEKEQSSKSRKRKRVSRGRPSRTSATPRKHTRKKQTKGEVTLKSEKRASETEDEDGDEHDDGGEEDNLDGLPDEDEAIEHSEDAEENESENDDLEEDYSHKGRRDPKKRLRRRDSSAKTSKKTATPEKAPPRAATKSPMRTSSKRKADEDISVNKKAFLRKKKEDDVIPKKKMSSPKPDKKEKKTTGKKSGSKTKSNKAADSGPTEEDLRKIICEILKEVDFNTATFTDILRKLASHYNMDLTARKASIKLMIQDELTKIAQEAEDEDGDNEDESEKDEDPEPASKKAEA